MLKYIFAAVFIALAWAAVLVFPETLPIWLAVLATVIILGVLGAIILIRFAKAKLAAARIENAMADQAKAFAGNARPDQAPEIAAMQAEFQRAVQALKSSKLGRDGRDALGILPWYVIIGPPGAGKTTALRNSGLKFPTAGKGRVRGVGGTRNCDWWLTNEAILLDTAGRWSIEDDDRDEWLAFLDMLKLTRPKKPMNGIVVAVSVNELLADEEGIESLAHTLRERVNEVIGRLEVVLPVYLMVTKCDLLPGFVETFGDLRDKERGQIWGVSLPLMADGHDRHDLFAEQGGQLAEVLEQRTLLRLGEERSLEGRLRIYEFPQQFESLRESLAILVDQMFIDNAYQEAPIMRGIYFTSGTQEGQPIDRVMSKVASAFGLEPRVMGTMAPLKPKSYFVRDVFTNVIIPDRDVAMRSANSLRKERLLRLAVAAGSLAVAGLALFLPWNSYRENRELVGEASSFVERLAGAKHNGTSLSPATLEALQPTAARLEHIAVKGGPGFSMTFGLYPGERLLHPMRRAIDHGLVRPLLDTDAAFLETFARRRLMRQADEAQEALTLHLLLTYPKAQNEPAPERPGWKKDWVGASAARAGTRWEKQQGERATPPSRAALESSVHYYVLRAEESPALVERKPALVDRVRAVLGGVGDRDPLGDLIRDPSMPRDLRFADVVGGAAGAFKASDDKEPPVIPGAFTPDGWAIVQQRFKRMSEPGDPVEDWVLGEAAKRERAIDVPALQVAYFRKYVDVWKNLILALALKEPITLEDARTLLRTLLTERPLDTIWRTAGRNLAIKDDSALALIKGKATAFLDKKISDKKKKTLGDEAGDDDSVLPGGKRKKSEEPDGPLWVGDQFASFLGFGTNKPSGLDAYGQALAEFQSALGDSGAPDLKQFQSTLRAQKSKLAALLSSYNEFGWEGGALERILMPPLRGMEAAVLGATGDVASRKWCENIVAGFDQLLAGRYPFASGRQVRDARVADVEKFFMPKSGTLWQYFDSTLAGEIDHPAGTAQFRVKDDATTKYRPALLAFLRRAAEISDFLFAKDPSKITVGYAVRMLNSPPYSKVIFESGDKHLTYFNSRERWEDMVWPARGAVFRFQDRDGEGEVGFTDGEWALFHLVDDGHFTRSTQGEDYLHGSWQTPLGDGEIRTDLKPVSLWRPFHNFEIPHAIIQGARACGGGDRE